MHPRPPPLARVNVVAGAHGSFFGAGWGSGTPYTPSRVLMHPKYNPNTNENDVALVFLNQCVALGPTVQPIKLGTRADFEAHVAANGTMAVSGWGTTSNGADSWGQSGRLAPALQAGFIRFEDAATCTKHLETKIHPDNMFCAGNVPSLYGRTPMQDSCQGDSGGPVTINTKARAAPLDGSPADDVLVGVVSWGYGCGQEHLPGVYASVGGLRDWIAAQMDASKSPCAPPERAAAPPGFVLASATLSWAGKPAQSARVPAAAAAADAAPDAAAAVCRARCAARAGGCSAFSVSVRAPARGRAPAALYCDMWAGAVPGLCEAGDKAFSCARPSAGAWRVSYDAPAAPEADAAPAPAPAP